MKPIFKCFLFGVFFCGVAASLMAAEVANVPPTISPLSNGLSIRENDLVVVAIYAPTDVPNDGDGDTPLTIVWDFEADPTGQAAFLARDNSPVQTISGSTSAKVALSDSGGNAVGQTIKARVSVSDGIDTSTLTFDIPVTGVNHAPDLIVDQSGLGTLTNPILEGSGFGVNASQSRDPDGGTVKFFWSITGVSGPTTCAGSNSFVLQGYYGANPGFVVPQMRSTPANPTRVTIAVRIEDGLIVVTRSYTGYIASSNGSCVVNPPGGGGNSAPLVSAAANPQHASFSQQVSLVGTATDPGDTLTYSWVQLSATTGSPVVISGSTSKNASFTAPGTATFLTFRFTATDSGGLSRSMDVTVQVSATGGGSGGGGGGGGGNATGTPSGTASGTAVCTGLASQGGTNMAAHATVPATYTIEGGNQADISVTGGIDPDHTTVTVGGAGTISGVTYQWDVLDNGGGLFLGLTGTQTATVHFTPPAVTTTRTGRLRVAVNDPVNCGTNYEVSVVVNPPTNNPSNNNPTANLRYSVQGTSDEGLNPTSAIPLSPPVQITLNAAESTDPDGDSLTYNWTVNPTLAGVALSQGTSSRTLGVVEGVTGTVTVTVSVNDGNGGNVSRAVTFQFQPPTDKPVMAHAAVFHNGDAVSGAVGPGMVLVLSGAESSVVDGTTEENNGLTFLWQQTGGPLAFTRNLTSRDAEIVVEGITETTNLTFRLTARNGTAVGTTDVSFSVDPALAEQGEDDSGPLYFARVGFGPVQGLQFQTLLVLDNRSAEDADDTLIEFFDSEGQPLDVRYFDNSVSPGEFSPWDSSQPFLVAGQSSRVLEFREAEGAGIGFGWAKVTSAHRLRGSIRFQLVDSDSGEFLSDVGILSSPVGSEFQAAFRNQDNLAFAISNPGDEAVQVKVKVERLSGGAFEDILELPAGGHTAQFLRDFFTFVNLDAIREGTLRLQVMDPGKTVVATVLITRDSLAVSSQSFARVR